MPSLTSGIRPVLTSGARRPAHVGRAACNCRSLPRSRQGAVSRIRATARRLSVRVRMDGSRSVFRPQRTPHRSAAVEGAAAHRTINVGRFITRRGFLIGRRTSSSPCSRPDSTTSGRTSGLIGLSCRMAGVTCALAVTLRVANGTVFPFLSLAMMYGSVMVSLLAIGTDRGRVLEARVFLSPVQTLLWHVPESFRGASLDRAIRCESRQDSRWTEPLHALRDARTRHRDLCLVRSGNLRLDRASVSCAARAHPLHEDQFPHATIETSAGHCTCGHIGVRSYRAPWRPERSPIGVKRFYA